MTSVPPVARDGFAFANGDLYAEASGHNRHRRATLAELKTHFDSGSDKDHPAHWFEAQLVHYGLPPSKTKAVARMRLFDAVKAAGSGALKVPAHVSKLEGELKKEWTKLDREAKKALKANAATTTPAEKKTGAKRKAEESVDVTVSVGGINITVSKGTATTSSAQSASKKAKTTAATPKATTSKAATPKTVGATKAATPKAAASKPTASKAKAPPKDATPKAATSSKPAKEKASSSKSETATPKSKAKPAQDKKAATNKGKSTAPEPTYSASAASPQAARKPRTKQTARKSAYYAVSALDGSLEGYMSPPQGIEPRGRTKQTARKFSARPVSALGHGYHNDPMDVDDEPPPPYTEYSDTIYSSVEHERPVSLEPLGLLNGRYDIASPDVSGGWPHVGEDFDLVLTLAGSSLWGRFDLGIVEGVFRLDQRPYESSNNELSFIWRGREHEGPIMYGNSHRGWIKFLGGGRVEGYLDFQGIEFYGERLPGQSTTSEISAREMEREWNGYSEAVYDRENRARWG